MNQIYVFETDGQKCGFCNYRTQTHYLIAEHRENAEELFHLNEDEQGPRGFCAQCLIEQVIRGNDYRIVEAPEAEA